MPPGWRAVSACFTTRPGSGRAGTGRARGGAAGTAGAGAAAGVGGGLGVLHHPPRLGQVEDDAIEARLVDALVDVALLDPVPALRPGAAERPPRSPRPFG